MSTCIPIRFILTICFFKLKAYAILFNIRDIYLICKIKNHLFRCSRFNRQHIRSLSYLINIFSFRDSLNSCRSNAYNLHFTC